MDQREEIRCGLESLHAALARCRSEDAAKALFNEFVRFSPTFGLTDEQRHAKWKAWVENGRQKSRERAARKRVERSAERNQKSSAV